MSAVTTSAASWRYAAMNLAMTISAQLPAFFTLYYVDRLKVSPQLWAVVLGSLAVYNAVDNPLIGHLSDRTRTRWGRRVVYLLFCSAPSLLALIGLFASPFDALTHEVGVVVWFVVWWLVWETAGTAMGGAYLSLLPEMFTSFAERARVAVRMNVFQVVGLLIGLAAPPALAQALGWPAAVAILVAVALVAIYQGVPVLRENVPSTAALPSLWSSMRSTFANRGFITIVAAQTMRFVATGALTTGMGLYVKYSLGGDDTLTSLLLALAFVVAGAFLWPWRRLVADRVGARGTLILAYAVVALGAALLAVVPSMTAVYAVTCLVGVGLSGLILMGDVVMADVIDADELATGERRAGAFFGIAGLLTTLSGTIVAAAFGWVATAYGYDPKLPAQAASAGQGFRVFMAGVPAVASVIGIALLLSFPLHGSRLRDIRERLAAQRAAAEPPADAGSPGDAE